jgi:hypothetical protein
VIVVVVSTEDAVAGVRNRLGELGVRAARVGAPSSISVRAEVDRHDERRELHDCLPSVGTSDLDT